MNLTSSQTATIPSVPVHAASASNPPKLKFNGSDSFLRELRKRVDAYFEKTGKPRRDCPRMYFKTATIVMWFFSAYLLLVFFAASWWTVIPLAVVLGLAMAAIGFNIQHDGGHKAYSNRPWMNKIMGLTLDLVGGSSYMWNWKHNTIHHTYTNIQGHDDDINVGFLARLAPQQRRLAMHRVQFVYLWFLYGFLAIKWHFWDDFQNVITGKIGGVKIPRPKGKDLAVFIGGKIFFFSLAFGMPCMFHSFWLVLGVYAMASFVSGVVMSAVFQLAHCVTEAEFPSPVPTSGGGEKIETEWAIHQVQTTVNFSRRNPILCWFLGGLNFQVEHHLFSRICHVNYPALSKVVEATCREFGVQYRVHRSLFSAIASHFRWLVQMGRPVSQG